MVVQLIMNRILWRFKLNYLFARAYPESDESHHILTPSSCRTNFNTFFLSHLCLSLPSVVLLSGFTGNILYGFIIFSICVICRVHLIIKIRSPATKLWAVEIDPCYFQHKRVLPLQLDNKSYCWFKWMHCSPLTFVLTVCNGRWVIRENNCQLYTIGNSGKIEWANSTYSTNL